MVFIVFHYLNHALGNISIEAMEEMQVWRKWIWQTLPGTVLLYGALLNHVLLSIWKLIARKSLKLPMWEWAQIILGLLIPYFLLTHITAMRGTEQIIGIEVNYTIGFGMMWPGAVLSQSFLLLICWVHACLGIHFWQRLNRWYSTNIVWLAAIGVLIPSLALTGWINAARQSAQQMALLRENNSESAQAYFDTLGYIYSEIVPITIAGSQIILAFAAALIVALIGHQIFLRFKKNIRVDYGEGKLVTTASGNTILEISRQAGIPHMSVCGGRARCSTCRTLIVEGTDNLYPKTEAEKILLEKLNAEDSIRLACQAKVRGNITLRPLVQLQKDYTDTSAADPLGWGVEREIAILFLDIRGFSRISEKSLPYDVVFILNSFFGEIASAVEKNNGYVDKFMGDGMMALFGLNDSPENAAKDALRAAIDCQKAAKSASKILTQHLEEPIKIGVGVHIGDAVIGRIGKTSDQRTPSRLTAIGDSVNISARLEQATKEFATPLVVSAKTATIAGLENIEIFGEKTTIQVRNISNPVEILAIEDLNLLENALQ